MSFHVTSVDKIMTLRIHVQEMFCVNTAWCCSSLPRSFNLILMSRGQRQLKWINMIIDFLWLLWAPLSSWILIYQEDLLLMLHALHVQHLKFCCFNVSCSHQGHGDPLFLMYDSNYKMLVKNQWKFEKHYVNFYPLKGVRFHRKSYRLQAYNIQLNVTWIINKCTKCWKGVAS